MKIIEIYTSESGRYARFRPDTALLRNNDNFYIPYDAEKVTCRFGYAAIVTRQAKSVEPRFAGRCYEKIGCVLAFTNETMLESRMSVLLPSEEAYSFDHSFAVSPLFVPADSIDGHSGCLATGNDSDEIHVSGIVPAMDEAIHTASGICTLRTGDIVCFMTGMEHEIHKGERICLSLGEGMPEMDFEIR